VVSAYFKGIAKYHRTAYAKHLTYDKIQVTRINKLVFFQHCLTEWPKLALFLSSAE